MKYIATLVIVSCVFLAPSYAQSAEDSVKKVIDQLFVAMNKGDGESIRSLFHEQAIMQTIVYDKEGKESIKDAAVEQFIASIDRLEAGVVDEQIVFENISLDGPLATVWTPYTFCYNGQLSHSGVNCFVLVRQGAAWKIQYIIDTRNKG